MLTPLDIQKKEFTNVFRGYKTEEVDAFLDKIIFDYEKLYRECLDLRDQVAQAERNVDHYREMENALHRTLAVVQKTAEEVKHQAKSEAQSVLEKAKEEASRLRSEAESEAATIIGEAEKKAAAIITATEESTGRASGEVNRFERQVQLFKMQHRALLEAQLRLLEEEWPNNLLEDWTDKGTFVRAEPAKVIEGSTGSEDKPATEPDKTEQLQTPAEPESVTKMKPTETAEPANSAQQAADPELPTKFKSIELVKPSPRKVPVEGVNSPDKGTSAPDPESPIANGPDPEEKPINGDNSANKEPLLTSTPIREILELQETKILKKPKRSRK